MKTILYATDYSKNSVAALKYAYLLSTTIHATLDVIHVFDYPTMLDDLSLKAQDPFPDIEGDTRKKHQSKLKSFCETHLETDLRKIDIRISAVESKSVTDGIIAKANEINSLVVVTGMKGGSGLREIIMGKTAKQLIDTSPCPVITIPEDSSHRTIKNIVYASDFEEEDIGALLKLVEIMKPFEAKIKIVHISPLEEKNGSNQKKMIEDKIRKYIDYNNFQLDIIYSEDVFHELKLYLGDADADLIAMLEREEKSLTAKLFHRDLVKKLETYGKIPLISFNAKNYGIFHI
tara:strand:- start:12887 stop:13756 length:870 start_codon:yes stop_codon:yes gene_type:complete